MSHIIYEAIGIIHTPWSNLEDVPSQSTIDEGSKGYVELLKEFEEGLADLNGFSHLILLFHMHKSSGYELKTIPKRDTKLRGLFSTRSPHRPNPIGLSVVTLERIERNILYLNHLDMLDNTPLLDIKPYVPMLSRRHGVKIGWLADTEK